MGFCYKYFLNTGHFRRIKNTIYLYLILTQNNKYASTKKPMFSHRFSLKGGTIFIIDSPQKHPLQHHLHPYY